MGGGKFGAGVRRWGLRAACSISCIGFRALGVGCGVGVDGHCGVRAGAVTSARRCSAAAMSAKTASSLQAFGFGVEFGGGIIGRGVVQRGITQHSLAAFGGTAEAGGVAAQAEDLGDGEVVGHRSVEGIEDGEAEGDDLGDVEEIDVFAGLVGFDGFGGGHAGVLDVAAGGGEEHRC